LESIAEAQCNQHQNGHLVSILSEAEADYVVQLARYVLGSVATKLFSKLIKLLS
jgi:hypothetical protein